MSGRVLDMSNVYSVGDAGFFRLLGETPNNQSKADSLFSRVTNIGTDFVKSTMAVQHIV